MSYQESLHLHVRLHRGSLVKFGLFQSYVCSKILAGLSTTLRAPSLAVSVCAPSVRLAQPLFLRWPDLQSETGSETLPDNPPLPSPQDSRPRLFAGVLISRQNKASRPGSGKPPPADHMWAIGLLNSTRPATVRPIQHWDLIWKQSKHRKEIKDGKSGRESRRCRRRQ